MPALPAVTWPLDAPHHVVVAGDWHGNTAAAVVTVELAHTIGAPLVLQLGDFGLWPGQEGQHYLNELNDAARELNVHIGWIDGNHEDFTQLARTPVSADGLQWQRSHIAHIPRGSHWTWHEIRFAALGGATSLDRPQRTPGASWWAEEAVNDNDLALLAAAGPCDVLLTHDCPTGVPIPGIGHRNYQAGLASGWSLSELERAWDHRDRMLEAVQAVRPRHIWHGHYHLRYSSSVTLHPDGPTHVEGLSCDGDPLTQRTFVATLTNGEVRTTNTYEAADPNRTTGPVS